MDKDRELSLDEALGLTKYLVPSTPEQDFFDHMTAGAAPRIDNMLYELRHNIEHYKHLKECGVKLFKNSYKAGVLSSHPDATAWVDLTGADYIKIMIKYYFQMMHYTRFVETVRDEDGSSLPKLDLDKTVALFMEHGGVKKIIRGDEKGG